MIKRMASKFIKEMDLDTREGIDEIKRVVRLQFVTFCKKTGVENTIKSYREYRSVVRSVLDLTWRKEGLCLTPRRR
jgi:hypothetical protein